MKRHLFTLVALVTIAFSASALSIIPQPLSIKEHNNDFILRSSTSLVCSEDEFAPLIEYIRQYLGSGATEGRPLIENSGNKGVVSAINDELFSNCIIFLRDTSLGAEEYRLLVSKENIRIVAGGYGGAFNGVQTLFQLLPSEVYAKQLSLPAIVRGCDIADKPRFAYRGFMLDVARTWMKKEFVLNYIDYISHHKINKLHWHLTDDQGWRIEIKSHPALAKVGGFRGGDSPLCAALGKWEEKYGGYYTQDEIREIVAYAAVRNVEIIPEIDLPGHSEAFARVYPQVLCNYTRTAAQLQNSGNYDNRNVLCATKESNYLLLDDILAEVCALFPSKYIHLGGDEVITSQWRRCPDCSAWLRERGYTDGHKLEDMFMARVERILAKYGKLPAVWNEAATSGDLSKKALVHGWRSVKVCHDAVRNGYRTVFMPQEHFYLDMRQSSNEIGAVWGGCFDVRKTYAFDISKQGLTQEDLARVEGFEAPFWSEISLSQGGDTSTDFIEYQTFPRLCALAEHGWGKNGGGEWQEFHQRLYSKHYDRMAAMGINFRITPPTIHYADGVLSVEKIDNSTIYYREEFSDKAIPYTEAISTLQPGRYLFWSEYRDAKSPEVAHSSHYKTIRPSVKLTSSMPENPKFGFSRVAEYSEYIRTSRSCRKGDWILFEFEKPVECRAIEFCAGFYASPSRLFQKGYLEVSEDGKHFKRVADLDFGHAKLINPRPIKAARLVSECGGKGQNYITIVSPKIYPKW